MARRGEPLLGDHPTSLLQDVGNFSTMDLTAREFHNTIGIVTIALEASVKVEPKPWEERVSTGEVVGRDPRKMSPDELRAMGHEPMPPLAALRLRCIDCCGGSVAEVRYCTARKCPSWPFRMGTSPWREKIVLSDEERERRSNLLKNARANRRLPMPE